MIAIDTIHCADYFAESPPTTFNVLETTSAGNKIVFTSYDTSKKASTIMLFDHSQELQSLLTKQPWIVSFLQQASNLNDVQSLLPYYKEINNLIVERKFDECNCFINYVRVYQLSDNLLVGLLRLTYSWKNELPSWSLLLERSKKELSKRGYDSENLLRGLV